MAPTRIAVYADVHAYLRELRLIHDEIRRAGIQRIWCLGDFVSGGPEPSACFDLVMGSAEVVWHLSGVR